MSDERKMKAFSLNKELFGRASKKTDPAYRHITEGLEKEISKLL